MKWLPAQDDLLLQMMKRNMSITAIAARMGCDFSEVRERYQELTKPASPDDAPKENALPTPEQVAEIKKNLDPLQSAFLDLCSSYNDVGAGLRAFGELVSSALAAEELETVIQKCLDATREPGESVAQKIARVLHGHCIVLVRPQPKTETHEQVPG